MKRFICYLFTFILFFGTVACTKEAAIDKGSEKTEAPLVIKEDTLVFVKDNISQYTSICPSNATDAKIISISQPDNATSQKPCMCKDCQEIYTEEGAYSEAQIRFFGV